MVKLLPVLIPIDIKKYVTFRLSHDPFREVRLSFFRDDLEYLPNILEEFNLVEVRRTVPLVSTNIVRIYVERRG